MRLVVAGADANGRSAVIRDEELPTSLDSARFQAGRGVGRVIQLWETKGSPPVVERPAAGDARTSDRAPGDTWWTVLVVPPGGAGPLHRTDTLSYNVLLEGQAGLVLDTGTVTLDRSDLLVCLGVRHGWKFGPDGATLLSMSVGLDPV